MNLEIGKQYSIRHSRKGKFFAVVDADNGEWVDVTVTNGKANFRSTENILNGRGEVGDTMTLRKSFCEFKRFDLVDTPASKGE